MAGLPPERTRENLFSRFLTPVVEQKKEWLNFPIAKRKR